MPSCPLVFPCDCRKVSPSTSFAAMPKGETDLYERPRAVAQEMLKPDRHLARPLDQSERNLVSTNATYRCTFGSPQPASRSAAHATRSLGSPHHPYSCHLRSGLLSSLGAGVVSGALVAAANAFSPRFRGALGVSGKTALIVTPTAGAFFLSSQLSINGATKDGGASVGGRGATIGATIGGATATAPAATALAARVSSLPLWCRAANQLYESPFKTIMAICAPAYGSMDQVVLPPSVVPEPGSSGRVRPEGGRGWRLWLAQHSQGKRPSYWAPWQCLWCSS